MEKSTSWRKDDRDDIVDSSVRVKRVSPSCALRRVSRVVCLLRAEAGRLTACTVWGDSWRGAFFVAHVMPWCAKLEHVSDHLVTKAEDVSLLDGWYRRQVLETLLIFLFFGYSAMLACAPILAAGCRFESSCLWRRRQGLGLHSPSQLVQGTLKRSGSLEVWIFDLRISEVRVCKMFRLQFNSCCLAWFEVFVV